MDWGTGLISERSNWLFVSDGGSRFIVYTCIYLDFVGANAVITICMLWYQMLWNGLPLTTNCWGDAMEATQDRRATRRKREGRRNFEV